MFSKKTYRDTRWFELILRCACYPMNPDRQFTVAPQLYENWHQVRNDFWVNVLQHNYPPVEFIRIKNGKCQCMIDGTVITVSEGGINVQQKDLS